MPAGGLQLTLSRESSKAIGHLEHLALVAEFENRGKKPLSIVIDAVPLSHGRYSVEFTDDKEQPVNPRAFGMCGTMSPLLEHEIALVEPGAAFRTPVHAGRGTLAPGSYRVRVRYEAYRSDHGKESWAPAVVQRLKHFWAGTRVSNWVSFELK